MSAQRNRSGFSTLEVMVVLAIMSLGVAIVLPRGSVMLDRMTAQAVFFEFQQAVSERRLDAFRAEQSDVIAQASGMPGALPLRAPWTYRLNRPLEIGEGGVCAPADVEIRKDGKRVMTLRTLDRACRFLRLD